ncbi:PPA1309 family protein [Saccharothrix sp. NPDC042600]|uniref:PPA1309 family protein n=1 Tax=Saccharothrix TaxID=2071 RepID=UPI0033F4BA23|nr:PPA1309 family protein [Saccharothrix mutabilis subsp. capreolus]
MAGVPASEKPTVALPAVAREVEQFVSAAGWNQPPQLFALVPTTDLLAQQPELAGQLDPLSAPLTPIAQDALPSDQLDQALAGIVWPEVVHGCALAQEIVVLPPEAEEALSEEELDDEAARRFAAEHPQRREARLVAAVLRDGSAACVLRLRGSVEVPEEVVEHPELAPNLTHALLETLKP